MIPHSDAMGVDSENLFRLLFENATAGMSISGPGGALQHTNQAFRKMLGYDENELQGAGIEKYIHAEDRGRVEEDRISIGRGTTNSIVRQIRFIHKTGIVMWMEQETYMLKDPRGSQPMMVSRVDYPPAPGTLRDQIEAPATEEGLKDLALQTNGSNGNGNPAPLHNEFSPGIDSENESEYGRLVHEAEDPLFVLDAVTGKFLHANQACCKKLGYPKTELLKLKISAIEDTEEGQSVLEEFGKTSRDTFRINSKYKCKNKSTFPAEVCVKFISDKTGEYLVANVRDVSHRIGETGGEAERKRIETALKSQQGYLEQIMNASSNLIFVKNSKGVYTKVNKAFAAIYDAEASELEGKTDADFHPDSKEIIYFREKDQAVISTMKPAPPYETMLKDGKTGQVRWFQTNKVPLITAEGEVEVLGIATDITQRKQVTEVLRTKQQYLDQILNSSPDMIFVKNWDGIFTMVNKACAAVYNTTVDDMLGKSEEYFNASKEDIAFYLEKDREVMVKRQPTPPFEEIRTDPKTGEIRWYLVSKVPLISQNGTAEVLTITNDITAAKVAEDEIRRQKNFYETFLNNLPIDFAVLNSNGRYIYCNPNAIKNNEVREWVLGKDDFDYCSYIGADVSIAEKRKEMFSRALQERKEVEMEEVMTDEAGKSTYSIKRFYPIFADDGKLKMMLAFGLNVTDRRRAEEKVKENEELLQSINANIRDAIFRSTLHKGMIYANQAMVDMFGYSSVEEVLQAPDILLMNPEIRKALVKEVVHSGQVLNKEIKLTRKDGSTFWGLLNVIRTEELNNDVTFDGALVDISNLKKTEELLTSKNSELEKANAELDSFVYCASHDLRAPLSSLLGLITVAESEARGMQQEYLKMMKGSVNKLDAFVHDIINYYRNKTMDVHCKRINLRALLSDVIENLKFVSGVDRINFEVEINEDQPFYSDSLRLNLVFSNLISNAIKYHNFKQENPVIIISAEISEKKASIVIKDNGLGMANEHLDKIFDMFYRASSSNNGSGLGLYIVKETVTKLSGHVSVSSDLGAGTSFMIEVPNNIKI